MRVLLIFVVGLMAVAAFPERSQRIVGGSVTNINRYPDMAAMLFSRGTTGHRQGCGGTIINNRSILTAAHCTIGHAPARWQARLGSTNANSGGVVIPSSQIINHPQYNARTADNDVSIVRTSRAIGFTNVIRAGRFAGANFHVGDNQVVWVAGWGMTRENGPFSEQLRHVQVWTVNQNVCAQRYSGINRPITANMLCAGWLDVGGRDACQNDSGGPLYHNGVVVGVTSWGRGCAQPRFPGVYARVQRFANWINQNR